MAGTISQMKIKYDVKCTCTQSHKKCSRPRHVAAALFPENANLTVLMINSNYTRLKKHCEKHKP